MITKIRTKVVYAKVYLNRALRYVSLINLGLIMFLSLSDLSKYGIEIDIGKWIFPILFSVFLFLLFFGFMEDRLGIFKEEERIFAIRNPQLTKIIEKLEKIEERVSSQK